MILIIASIKVPNIKPIPIHAKQIILIVFSKNISFKKGIVLGNTNPTPIVVINLKKIN